jgi:hypothetical protein
MSHAGLVSVFLPPDIVIYVREADIFGASAQSAYMQFQVLHAEQCFIEAADFIEEAAPPDRTRNLPYTLMRQESQQIVPWTLWMIKTFEITY